MPDGADPKSVLVRSCGSLSTEPDSAAGAGASDRVCGLFPVGGRAQMMVASTIAQQGP